MELSAIEIEKAKQMGDAGRTIAQISKELSVDYWLVWNHVRSWQGDEVGHNQSAETVGQRTGPVR